jgi:hypothetical protein
LHNRQSYLLHFNLKKNNQCLFKRAAVATFRIQHSSDLTCFRQTRQQLEILVSLVPTARALAIPITQILISITAARAPDPSLLSPTARLQALKWALIPQTTMMSKD